MTGAGSSLPPAHRVVLFDLDGTLVDTIPLIVASFQHAAREVLGLEVEQAQARAWIGRPLLPVMLEISPDHGVELDRVYREWNLAHTCQLIAPFAGIDALLASLAAAGVTTAIVTSKRQASARLALECVGLESMIDVVAALEDTDAHKPSPAPLQLALARLGAHADDAVYVGDATVDIAAARAAGMASVAVTWGAGLAPDLQAAGPDRLVDSVAELTAYLLPGHESVCRGAG